MAGVYLRSALNYRGAVDRGAHDSAARLLRAVADTVESELAAGLVPLFRAARGAALLHPDGAAERSRTQGGSAAGPDPIAARVIAAMTAARDSLQRCRCGPLVGTRSVGYWNRATGALTVEPAERTGALREAVELAAGSISLAEPRVISLTSPAGRPPAFLQLLHLRDSRAPAAAVLVDIDLDSLARLAARQFEPVLARSLPNTTPAERAAGAALRLVHAGGAELLAIGSTQAGFTARAGGPDEPAPSSAAPRLSLALSGPLLPAIVPGGLPASPWPLAIGSIVLSLALAGLTLLTLYRFDRLVALKEQFVSGVTHELRTPITQILLYGETLQLERPTPEARRRAAEVIVREARRLSRLVENALAFTRGQRPNVGLTPETLDLGAAVAAAAAEIEPLMGQRRSALEVATDGAVQVSIDPGALRQIVANLCENAAIHGPTEQTVSVTVQRVGDWAALVVADRGPGIPAAERSRIWNPFYRGAGGGATGTGLGLSIVRQLVELHGGTIAVTDRPGGGARFEARFPVVTTTTRPAGTTAARVPNAGPATT
jgi:signal transduction histidine kinase